MSPTFAAGGQALCAICACFGYLQLITITDILVTTPDSYSPTLAASREESNAIFLVECLGL
jgi:hypothetical protein